MDISPFKILKSSGSSSRDVERSNLPNFVNLALSGSNSPLTSLSSVIVLNLYIIKISSFSPGLFCLNRTELPNFVLTRIATTRSIGLRTIIAINDSMKSIGLFIHLL
ncbi:hypothetical protein JCM21714_4435 [Gracilibacillus boraciitolerans JCM 21714]|uniref:Uncharacterized protein n=1 Tax=Gracilibacillus boraciitolerans JCM 21714 TaxID=1298598 RepID=W4VPA8_9BACI|nr:hypothetical protein JCM21714_4435 [Gracilibacillus boraciitolerans JCM 21714]